MARARAAAAKGTTTEPAPFSTRAFRAPDIEFQLAQDEGTDLDEHVYRIPGDPDVDVLGTILELQESFGSGDNRETSRAIVEGKALLLDLIRQRQPEVEAIQIGVGELMAIFILITGGRTAAEEVAAALVGEDDEDGLQAAREPSTAARRAKADGEIAPLASRSRRSSSRSASSTGGRRTGGEESPGESPGSTSRPSAAVG